MHTETTEVLLSASRKPNIDKFIYLDAASVIMNGKPIVNADETFVADNIIDG